MNLFSKLFARLFANKEATVNRTKVRPFFNFTIIFLVINSAISNHISLFIITLRIKYNNFYVYFKKM